MCWAADQVQLALTCATKALGKLDGFGWAAHEGLPRIDGVVVWLACSLVEARPSGDHRVLVGLINDSVVAERETCFITPAIWDRRDERSTPVSDQSTNAVPYVCRSEFATIEEALAGLASGRMVVVDDEERENEGDLLMVAEHVTPTAIKFMTRQARGWLCLTLMPERCDELGLRPMADDDGRPGPIHRHDGGARGGDNRDQCT